MNLLDRYIFRQFAVNFLLILAALISIYLLIDVFERLDNFQEKQLPAGLIVRYFLAKIPVIYDQMAPVCLLLAGIITLGLLMNRLELQTMNAGGISKARVMRPLLIGVGIFTLLSVAMAQWLLPQASAQVQQIWQQQVQGKTKSGIVRAGVTYFRGKEGIYSFKEQGENRNQFKNFRYITLSTDGERLTTLFASQATATSQQWHFTNGYLLGKDETGTLQMTPFTTKELTLANSPADFFSPVQLASTMPLSVLVSKGLGAMSNRQDRVDLHRRLSFIFLGVPLLLIAMPLMLRFQQTRGSMNLALAVPASAGLAFFAWGIWSGLQALSLGGSMEPLVASWIIHLACSGVGMVMLWRNTKY